MDIANTILERDRLGEEARHRVAAMRERVRLEFPWSRWKHLSEQYGEYFPRLVNDGEVISVVFDTSNGLVRVAVENGAGVFQEAWPPDLIDDPGDDAVRSFVDEFVASAEAKAQAMMRWWA